MENRVNVAEILKGCPSGMPLDCTMYNNIAFCSINEESETPIKIKRKDGITYHLTKYGQINHHDDAKCIIFPKDKTTWEGFHRPFVKGDIVSTEDGLYVGIVQSTTGTNWCSTFCSINSDNDIFINNSFLFSRFATEEEKQRLFNTLKANAYHWDDENKILEKVVKQNINRFDVTALKPFDKVLVRDHNDCPWRADFYSHFESNTQYWCVCIGDAYKQCIPYNEETAYLLGTDQECPSKYNFWKK